MNYTEEQIQFIRNEVLNMEQEKDVSNNLMDFMYEHQLFKLIVPSCFGGKMLDLPEAIRAFQSAAEVDGDFGWLVTIGSGGGMFVNNFSEQAAKRFFTPKEALIAGSGFPAGSAKKVEGGYNITGEWKYCSGSTHASIFTVTCYINENREKPTIQSFILTREQVEVVKDWQAFGLKGTTSHSIRVNNQFVPENRVFSIMETKNQHGQAIHDFPFILFAEASFAAIVFGIGKHFLTEVRQILHKNRQTWSKGNVDRHAFLLNKLEKEEKRFDKAEQAFHHAVAQAWENHITDKEIPHKVKTHFTLTCKQGATTVKTCANQLFPFIGMEAVMEHSSLNKIWRDLHTASQHAMLTPYEDEEATPVSP